MLNKITMRIRFKYFKCGQWCFPGRKLHFGLKYGDFELEAVMDKIYFDLV